MLKGAKKAIVRAPHRFAGSKSIEDRIILEWSRDFNTAETALDVLISETKKFKSTWKDLCETQVKAGKKFVLLYEPIGEEGVYSLTQKTPESQTRAIQGYLAVVKEVEATIIPMLEEFEAPFVAKCKGAKECIDAVQKAFKKREHKKVDFDRASNTVEKLFRKTDPSEKEQQALAKAEEELETATEVFHAQDEKVKSTVPIVVTAMSEFLNPLTSQLYLNQLKVYKTWNQILFKYSQMQGLTGGLSKEGGELDYGSYTDVVETWEERFTSVQPRLEQSLKSVREGKAITKPLHPVESGPKKIEQLAHKSADKTNELAHKAIGKPSSATHIKFSSPQGFFQTEADFIANQSLRGSSSNTFFSDSSQSSSSPTTGSLRSPVVGSNGSFFSPPPAASISRSISMSQSQSQRSSSSIPSVLPAAAAVAGSSLGRSPVTGVFTGPPADTEQLRTRVRASMSTAARTLSPPSSADFYNRDVYDEQEGGGGLGGSGGLSDGSEEVNRRSGDFISNKLRQHQQEQLLLRRRSGSTAASTMSGGGGGLFENGIGGGGGGGGGKTPSPIRIPAGPNEHAVALFTFTGAEPGDVAFRVGDRVRVMDHGDETDSEWWLGQTSDGRLGLFPRTYVEVVDLQ